VAIHRGDDDHDVASLDDRFEVFRVPAADAALVELGLMACLERLFCEPLYVPVEPTDDSDSHGAGTLTDGLLDRHEGSIITHAASVKADASIR
jgi:hypothetical protein